MGQAGADPRFILSSAYADVACERLGRPLVDALTILLAGLMSEADNALLIAKRQSLPRRMAIFWLMGDDRVDFGDETARKAHDRGATVVAGTRGHKRLGSGGRGPR